MPFSIANSVLPDRSYLMVSNIPSASATPLPQSAEAASQRAVSPHPPVSAALPPAGARGGPAISARAQGLMQRSLAATADQKDLVRREKRALAQAPDSPARNTLGVLGAPRSRSERADKTLQARLIAKMSGVPDSLVSVPPRSLIAQPFEIFKCVVNQPEVLAWLRGKGFALDSVIISKDGISGLATRNGAVSHQTYTLQDTSGWWQVSGRVMDALEALDPRHQGVPYAALNSQQVSRNVASYFYGVRPPYTDEQAKALTTNFQAGWPSLSKLEIRERNLELEWVKRAINQRDDRQNLANALERAAHGLSDSAPLWLSHTEFEVSRTHPLRNDDDARKSLNALVERPEIRDMLAGMGAVSPTQLTRISEGSLQVFQSETDRWLNVPVEARGSQQSKDALGEVVKLSRDLGGALYSDERYNLRQVTRFMNLGELETAGQVRAAADWLRTEYSPPASTGNYATLLPQTWAPGTLTSNDKKKMAGLPIHQQYGANAIGTVLGNRIVTYIEPMDANVRADQIWAQLLNTPQAQEWGGEIARALGWYTLNGSQGVSSAERKNLVTANIMLSVDPGVPSAPGTAAGYSFYAPGNMGRDMGAVRKDFERHLVDKKGVSVRAAPLVAHLFLAHAAPEFLVRKNQQQSVNIPEELRLSPDKIRIGSPAWMTLAYGAALAEVWGGAGSSRGMSVEELGALTSQQFVTSKQQGLALGLGAKVVLDVGVMTGTVARRTDGKYTEEDYLTASAGIDRRSASVEHAIETMGAAPPTRTSLAIQALKLHLPELTDHEIRTLKLRKPATKLTKFGSGVNEQRPTLLEAYATGDLHSGWFGFSHPKITQAAFDARIKSLPKIADQVSGAVDRYLGEVKAVMPSFMQMSLANLPLEDRQALEWGKVDIYRLRQETGETQPQDAASGNKVALNRGWHGVLLCSEYKGTTRYHEFFPTSGRIIDRTADLVGKKLKLDGIIEEEREYFTRGSSKVHRFLRGTQQPFDFRAYLTGEAPRPGETSKVIVSRMGSPLAGASSNGRAGNSDDWVPDTFNSSKSKAIVDAILGGNYVGSYSEHRKAHIDYANAVLPSEDNVKGYVNRLMTQENGRAMVSMISFVGPVVDIFEGKVEAGLKGLAIDVVSFIGAGGLHATYKAWKAVKLASRLNRQAFRASALKEGTALLRGIFNPAEGFLDLPAQPGKLARFARRKYRGIPARVGMGVYVPADVFEKARFGKDTFPTASQMLEKAQARAATKEWPGILVPGTVNKVNLRAVNQWASWYAINPRTGAPFGPPIEGFVPKSG